MKNTPAFPEAALSNYRSLADSQGTSTVLDADDLKSKLGSLPCAADIGRAGGCIFFRLVKDTLVVGLSCALKR